MSNIQRQQTCDEAQRRLVEQHLTFARNLGKRYAAVGRMKGIPLADLQQEACMGLCEAALRYDPGKGVAFQTYAYLWCKKFITEAINRGMSADDFADVERLEEELTDEEEEADRERRAKVVILLGRLNEKERLVIAWAFGLEGEPKGFKEIADETQVSRARVRQIYDRAMAKMELVGRF